MTPRVFVQTSIQVNQTLSLPKPTAHHLCKVLRLKPGEKVILFNGQGDEYQAELISSGKQAEVKIEARYERLTESNIKIHLGQAVSRGDRMDFTLQKATELGVTEITPLITQRCLTKISPDKIEKKHAHWQQIIISASEQSGRTTLPVLHPAITLSEWVSTPFEGLSLMMQPESGAKKVPHNTEENSFRILVGPESGFSVGEIQAAGRKGFTNCQLGPRILRTETAALAMIASLQMRYGDFNL